MSATVADQRLQLGDLGLVEVGQRRADGSGMAPTAVMPAFTIDTA